MKLKSFLALVCILIMKAGAAQTNVFNDTGNVGIGRIDPSSPLHIQSLNGDSKPAGVSAPTTTILKFGRNGTPNYSYNEAAEFRIGHGGPSVWGSQLDLYLNGASNQTDNPDQRVMTWLYNGNVGLGTPTPMSKLEVVSHLNNNQLTLSKNTVAGLEGAGITFKNMINDGSIPEIGGIQAKLTSGTVGAVAGSLSFYTKFNSVKLEAVTINHNGNMGIGTATPMSKLEVVSDLNNDQLSLSKNTIAGSEGAGITFKNMINDGSIPEIGGIQAKLTNGAVGAVAGSLSLYTKFNSVKLEAVTISPVGNVGIGTATPLERLSVNGNIKAREIKVTVTASEWPDYVFDEGYKSLSLLELENFIKINKHLPDIPTAKEVQSDGIELGDMNKKLLKKIEELTLYLLESDKEIKMLKKSNKRIDQLERKLNELINQH